MIIQILVSFIASLGFGIIFNIKGKNLLFAAIGGSLGWFMYLLFTEFNISKFFSLFLSSLIFSTYSEICARLLKTPATTLIICALIPLVPGAGMYYTMYETIVGNVSGAIELGFNTLGEAGSLALGVIFITTITRQITSFKKVKI
ncbi:MAG: threonine/serine exporter family protein [Clostridium sp.]